MIGNKTCNSISLHRSPSLTKNDFEISIEDFERTLQCIVKKREAYLEISRTTTMKLFCEDS